MNKYPKIVQCDRRGQIVIPKDIRSELGIDESTAFWVFSISEEGILLKKADAPQLSREDASIRQLDEKAESLGIDRKNITKSVESYKRTKKGNLELI